MDHRTTSGHAARRAAASRRRLLVRRRPGALLAAAAAGAVACTVVLGSGPAAEAGSVAEPVTVAEELGLTAQSEGLDVTADLDPLEDLVASRSTREAAASAARQAQAKADRAELERQQKAAAAKKARAAAKKAAAAKEAAAKAAAAEEAAAETAEQPAEAAAPAASGTAVDAIAQISNSSGPVQPQTQAAANSVVSNVPGAGSITIGGTRASATDPGGHPSGLALDWMVLSDVALGNAIVQYHIANWDRLGVDYLIYRQRMLSSPGGAWTPMEDRGSATANHMDHPHVSYR